MSMISAFGFVVASLALPCLVLPCLGLVTLPCLAFVSPCPCVALPCLGRYLTLPCLALRFVLPRRFFQANRTNQEGIGNREKDRERQRKREKRREEKRRKRRKRRKRSNKKNKMASGGQDVQAELQEYLNKKGIK